MAGYACLVVPKLFAVKQKVRPIGLRLFLANQPADGKNARMCSCKFLSVSAKTLSAERTNTAEFHALVSRTS